MDHLQPIRDALGAIEAEIATVQDTIDAGERELKHLRGQRDGLKQIRADLRNALGMRADGTPRKAREEAKTDDNLGE